jgi:hypothetical protein
MWLLVVICICRLAPFCANLDPSFPFRRLHLRLHSLNPCPHLGGEGDGIGGVARARPLPSLGVCAVQNMHVMLCNKSTPVVSSRGLLGGPCVLISQLTSGAAEAAVNFGHRFSNSAWRERL